MFELVRTVLPFLIIPRESVIWFDLHERAEPEELVADHPHSKFLARCNEDIVSLLSVTSISKILLNRALANQSLGALTGGVTDPQR